MFRIIIHNEENQSVKLIGFSFKRKNQLSPSDVIWSMFVNVSQSRFETVHTDRKVHSVKTPVVLAGLVLNVRADRSRPWFK